MFAFGPAAQGFELYLTFFSTTDHFMFNLEVFFTFLVLSTTNCVMLDFSFAKTFYFRFHLYYSFSCFEGGLSLGILKYEGNTEKAIHLLNPHKRNCLERKGAKAMGFWRTLLIERIAQIQMSRNSLFLECRTLRFKRMSVWRGGELGI